MKIIVKLTNSVTFFIIFFQFFNVKSQNQFIFKCNNRPNDLFYFNQYLDTLHADKKNIKQLFENIKKNSELTEEVLEFIDIQCFIKKIEEGNKSEKQVLEFYQTEINKSIVLNSGHLMRFALHVPIIYYEKINDKISNEKLIKYYHKVYGIISKHSHLKFYGINVEITRLTTKLLNTGNYWLANVILKEYYDKTHFTGENYKNLGYQDVFHLNNLAISYFHTGQINEALKFYEIGRKRAIESRMDLWQEIIEANMAEIYVKQNKLDLAKSLFISTIDSLMGKNADNILAFSYLYLSEIGLIENNKNEAFVNLEKSINYLKIVKENKRWLRYYELKYQIELRFKNTLSDLLSCQDSITKYSSLVEDEESKYISEKYTIEILNENNLLDEKIRQNKKNQTKIYIVLISIIILMIIYLIYLRLIIKIRKIEKEKQLSDLKASELEKKLMEMVDEMIKKNNAIEIQSVNWEEYKLLTKNDWKNFLDTFNTLFPKFIPSINELGIKFTESELRISALIKLNLDTSNIAAMLGISESSVFQSKFRLKKKLGLHVNENLNEYIQKIGNENL